jgi:hypothetical protein
MGSMSITTTYIGPSPLARTPPVVRRMLGAALHGHQVVAVTCCRPQYRCGISTPQQAIDTTTVATSTRNPGV